MGRTSNEGSSDKNDASGRSPIIVSPRSTSQFDTRFFEVPLMQYITFDSDLPKGY